jgi:hypothetical protein
MTRLSINNAKLLLLKLAGMLLASLLGLSYAFAQEEELSTDLLQKGGTIENDKGSSQVASFFSSLSENRRNPIGLSFAAYQLYATSAIQNEADSHPANISIVRSRIFTNLGRRQSRLHFDFSGGYRFYKDNEQLNNAEGNGYISYEYQATRRFGIKITDRVSSQVNDFTFGSDSNLIQQSATPATSYTLMQTNHRVTLNNIGGELNLKLSRDSSLGFFSTYEIYQADNGTINNEATDIIQAGLNYEHKVTRWMSFTSNWSTYLNNVDPQYRDSKVYRVEIGGFHFNLSRRWDFNISGGADILDSKGQKRRTEGSGRAFLSHSSESNTLVFSYQRGFFSSNGLANVLQSDVFSARFGQKLKNWLNFQMSGSYFLSRDPIESHINGGAMTFTGNNTSSYNLNMSLEFSVLRNMVSVINAGYQNQKNTLHLFADNLNIDRYIASFGLQYFFPSVRR